MQLLSLCGLHYLYSTASGRDLLGRGGREGVRRPGLVPAIRAEDLEPAPAGIRAQAVAPDGTLVDDFLLVEGERVVNVCNAPSPAATASLRIGETIVDRLAPRFG